MWGVSKKEWQRRGPAVVRAESITLLRMLEVEGVAGIPDQLTVFYGFASYYKNTLRGTAYEIVAYLVDMYIMFITSTTRVPSVRKELKKHLTDLVRILAQQYN